MFSVDSNVSAPLQQSPTVSSRSKRRSRSSERTSRTKSRRDDRHSSSSSSDPDRDDDRESIDEDDDDDDDNLSNSDRSSQGSPTPKQKMPVRWDYRMNTIGRRIRDSKPLCCTVCQYPVIIAGRLMMCKHAAICSECAKQLKEARRNCPQCSDPVVDVEEIDTKNLSLCYHSSHPNSQDPCLRGYTSQRDLQEHVKRRHDITRRDSPHQFVSNSHPSTTNFPNMMVEPQQQNPLVPSNITTQNPVPPPLMAFPPIVAASPRPIFDIGFRPTNYVLPPAQQFVPPQTQYRPPPFPPNRPFY